MLILVAFPVRLTEVLHQKICLFPVIHKDAFYMCV